MKTLLAQSNRRYLLYHFKNTVFLIMSLFCFIGTAHAQWTRKADELSKRAECNNVVYKGKIYMFGGFGDNPTIEKTNEVYDIATNKWSRIASFPAGKEITHQGIVLIDDNVWLIGGRAVDAHGPVSSQVIIYNITTNTWTDGPRLINPATGTAFPIGGGGYALLGRTIHVFGGFGPTICEDQSTLHLTIDVDKYLANKTSVTWENKLAPMPIPRNHLSYVTLAGKIYALGGQFKHDCGAVDQIYCHVYDEVTNTWTRLKDLPVPRSHAEAATFAIDGKIFLVAGQGKDNVTQNTTYQFDPKANNGLGSWTNITAYKLPGSFLGLSARLVGNSFIITNGALKVYSDERKETYIANITRSKSRTLGFSASCLSGTIKGDTTVTFKNLLYCVEDDAAYSISSDADWLKITKKGNGVAGLNGQDIEASVYSNGMLPGTYKGNVTATSMLTGSKVSFCVNLTINGTTSGHTLKITTNEGGLVTQSPKKDSYNDDEVVVLNATPLEGWAFKGWSGDSVTATNPLNLKMDTDKRVAALFERIGGEGALITNITATTGKTYPLTQLHSGIEYYTDRAYTIANVPNILEGVATIRTANDDKANKSVSMLSFNLSDTATVYVAYDPRGTTLPAWLKGWQKLSDKLGVHDPKITSLNLYTKNFNPGKVVLGGNLASPAMGAQCQYVVLVKAVNGIPDTASITKLKMNSSVSVITKTYTMEIDTNKRDKNKINETDKVIKPYLYPNPASDNFTLVFPPVYSGVIQTRIIDCNGKALLVNNGNISFTPSSYSYHVTYSKLRPGLYSVIVTSNDGKNNFFKLIVK
ncbi:T9SS type A sorting domain-containing protein [Inquilinus sp. KBS0705]|nr:T9SS type A sorting domain-containing protein [Inquilinus sp. KBS0705]